MTVRHFLQLLGTEAIRNGLHPEALVNALFADYKLQQYQYVNDAWNQGYSAFPNWIITDARFPNELEAVKSRGGICILVKRNWSSKDATRQEEKIAAHQSETLQEDSFYDYILNNSGTIEDLVEEVRKMLVHFKLLT